MGKPSSTAPGAPSPPPRSPAQLAAVTDGTPPRWLSLCDAAGYARVAERTIRRWAAQRGLPVTRVGRIVRIDRQRLDAFLESHSVTRAGPQTRVKPRTRGARS